MGTKAILYRTLLATPVAIAASTLAWVATGIDHIAQMARMAKHESKHSAVPQHRCLQGADSDFPSLLQDLSGCFGLQQGTEGSF